MSRLDSFIRRVTAQRDCLNHAARLIADRSGPVLELGLGNGRTYDHLRELLPERDIFVFERLVAAHPDCLPPDDRLILGDFSETLPAALAGPLVGAALVHCDVGSGDKEQSLALGRFLAGQFGDALAVGAILLGDQPLAHPRFRPLPLPAEVEPGRYHFYEVAS